ncbi:MAG: tetratricopeptide repeat protein [Pseudomonadota bacterium]
MKYLATLFISLVLAGCASAPPASDPSRLFSDAAFAPPSERVGVDDLFTLSPAMRAYIDTPAFRAELRVKGPERGLFDALYRKGELQIEYNAATTRNAAQTYAAGSGNCLSLVIMTAAFAKELGLSPHFQNVIVDETWSREGALYLSNTHANLRLGPRLDWGEAGDPARQLTIDFLPPKDLASYRAYPLMEHELKAMYMNNRAVEAMLAGRLDDAYWWARGAVTGDPASAVGYNTLGVIYQRHGDMPMAERAFRLALEREPENLVAMRNLVPVLTKLDRDGESQALARRLAAIQPEPAFHFFTLGRAAMERGDFGAAKALFAREVKRAPYYDEFHFWLGLAHFSLGETEQAREQLALALKTSNTSDGRGRYAAKLDRMRAQDGQRAPAF